MNTSFPLRLEAGQSGLLLPSPTPSTESGARLRDKEASQKLGGHRMEWRVKSNCGGRAQVQGTFDE